MTGYKGWLEYLYLQAVNTHAHFCTHSSLAKSPWSSSYLVQTIIIYHSSNPTTTTSWIAGSMNIINITIVFVVLLWICQCDSKSFNVIQREPGMHWPKSKQQPTVF